MEVKLLILVVSWLSCTLANHGDDISGGLEANYSANLEGQSRPKRTIFPFLKKKIQSKIQAKLQAVRSKLNFITGLKKQKKSLFFKKNPQKPQRPHQSNHHINSISNSPPHHKPPPSPSYNLPPVSSYNPPPPISYYTAELSTNPPPPPYNPPPPPPYNPPQPSSQYDLPSPSYTPAPSPSPSSYIPSFSSDYPTPSPSSYKPPSDSPSLPPYYPPVPSYSPPKAPENDSYGSPLAPEVDSYGSPLGPVVDSYGTPQSQPITSYDTSSNNVETFPEISSIIDSDTQLISSSVNSNSPQISTAYTNDDLPDPTIFINLYDPNISSIINEIDYSKESPEYIEEVDTFAAPLPPSNDILIDPIPSPVDLPTQTNFQPFQPDLSPTIDSNIPIYDTDYSDYNSQPIFDSYEAQVIFDAYDQENIQNDIDATFQNDGIPPVETASEETAIIGETIKTNEIEELSTVTGLDEITTEGTLLLTTTIPLETIENIVAEDIQQITETPPDTSTDEVIYQLDIALKPPGEKDSQEDTTTLSPNEDNTGGVIRCPRDGSLFSRNRCNSNPPIFPSNPPISYGYRILTEPKVIGTQGHHEHNGLHGHHGQGGENQSNTHEEGHTQEDHSHEQHGSHHDQHTHGEHNSHEEKHAHVEHNSYGGYLGYGGYKYHPIPPPPPPPAPYGGHYGYHGAYGYGGHHSYGLNHGYGVHKAYENSDKHHHHINHFHYYGNQHHPHQGDDAETTTSKDEMEETSVKNILETATGSREEGITEQSLIRDAAATIDTDTDYTTQSTTSFSENDIKESTKNSYEETTLGVTVKPYYGDTTTDLTTTFDLRQSRTLGPSEETTTIFYNVNNVNFNVPNEVSTDYYTEEYETGDEIDSTYDEVQLSNDEVNNTNDGIETTENPLDTINNETDQSGDETESPDNTTNNYPIPPQVHLDASLQPISPKPLSGSYSVLGFHDDRLSVLSQKDREGKDYDINSENLFIPLTGGDEYDYIYLPDSSYSDLDLPEGTYFTPKQFQEHQYADF